MQDLEDNELLMGVPQDLADLPAAGTRASVAEQQLASPPPHPPCDPIPTPSVYADVARLPQNPPREEPLAIYNHMHKDWAVRAVMKMVAFLHTKFQVPFRACAIILFTLRIIFRAKKVLAPTDTMATTLTTVLKAMTLQDRFHVLPVCTTCLRLFDPSIPKDTVCPVCNKRLYPRISRTLLDRIRSLGKPTPEPAPALVAPATPVSDLIRDFMSIPGMEEEVTAWQTKAPSPPGEYHSIMDGAVWHEMVCDDGTHFFMRGDTGEIRIGLVASLDW